MNYEERVKQIQSNQYNAYCLFTLSGKENDLAEELNENYDYLYATVLKKIAHKSKNGVKTEEIQTLLKGYVFVYLPIDFKISEMSTHYGNYFRVLGSDSSCNELTGDDLEYARMVLACKGLIDISKAIKENDKVRIISGPLKEMEGYIIEYSKKNRNCCVEIDFAGQKIKMWLPFEWVESEE